MVSYFDELLGRVNNTNNEEKYKAILHTKISNKSLNKLIDESQEGGCDRFACVPRPVSQTAQVFYCTKNCTISLNICTVIWTVFAAVT